MMNRLPLLQPQELARVLAKLGFRLVRQEGSHMLFEHPDGRVTVIPNHPGEEIRRGLLNKIVKKDLRMEREESFRVL